MALLSVLVTAGVAFLAFASPEFTFVAQRGRAAWILLPEHPTTGVVATPSERLPAVEFSRRFRVDGPPAGARIRIEAVRGFELELNGRRIAGRPWQDTGWKRTFEIEAPSLRAGTNELRIKVRNPTGPPLLRVLLTASNATLVSDTSWLAGRPGEPPVAAAVADDRIRAPSAAFTPSLASAVSGVELILILVSGVALAWMLRSGPAALSSRPLPVVGIGIVGLWLYVFVARAIQLPAFMGFDGPDHLAYVQAMLEGALPLAGEGAQTHHPPLFYALSAALLRLLEGVPNEVALRLIPFASGLAQIGVALGLARALFPGDRLRTAATVAAVGLMPMNLYMSAYLSNETLHGALAACSLLLATRLLLAGPGSARGPAAAGAVLGSAILTKVSSLVLVPFVLVFLALKQRLVDRGSLADVAGRAAAFLGGLAAVSGWYFLRNQSRLGRPVVGNWAVPGSEVSWWQSPGFHTPDYYLRFGGALDRPFFASFDSFWDGLYSTFWGDGLIGGVSAWGHRHSLWDYDLMTLGYALAVPATGLLLFGLAGFVREALSPGDPRRRIVFAFLSSAVLATGLSILLVTLRVPAYSMTKASYGLSMAAPLGLAFADGFARLRAWLVARGGQWASLPLDSWAAALGIVIALSYAG
jgi:hypothetical protein